MKISIEEVDRIRRGPIRDPMETEAPGGAEIVTGGGERPDAATISRTSPEVHEVVALLEETPDTREDYVQTLKAQIESGTYEVSGEDIADLIIRRSFADRIR